MRPAARLEVRGKDKSTLRSWVRASGIRAGLAQRARIVLLAGEGLSNTEIASRVGVSRPTVLHWRATTRQAIRRGSFDSVRELIDAIRRFIDAWNERCEPFTWTKDADTILAKAQRQTSSDTRH